MCLVLAELLQVTQFPWTSIAETPFADTAKKFISSFGGSFTIVWSLLIIQGS